MTDNTDPLAPPPIDSPPAEGVPDELPADIRSRLSVPPLDEVTRARLVHAALDGAPAVRNHQRRVRWLAAAAALVAVVAVGIGVLARDSDAPRPTASAPAADRSIEKDLSLELEAGGDDPAATLSPSESSFRDEVAASSLGNLGEIGRASELRAAVKGLSAMNTRGQFQASCPAPDVGPGALVISGASATVRGEPATVYVISVPGTGKVAVAVVSAGCRTVLAVRL